MRVPENTIMRIPRVSKVVKITAKCFLKHGIPFQHDLDTRMLERVNLMKVKCVDPRFKLGYKPKKKKNYRWVAGVKRETRMAGIEGT